MDKLFKDFLAGKETFKAFMKGGCRHKFVYVDGYPWYLGNVIVQKCTICGKVELEYE